MIYPSDAPFHKGRQQLSVVKTDVVEAESLVRDLAETEAAINPGDFAGKSPCVYFKLPYIPQCEPFKELRKLILRVKESTGLRAYFKGVVAIEVTEWIGHEQEEYFTVILKYLYDHRDNWVSALVLNNPTENQLHRFTVACAKYISPRLYDACLFTDKAILVERIRKLVSTLDGVIDQHAAEELAAILMRENLKHCRSLSLVERVVEDAIMISEEKAITAASIAEIMGNPYSTIALLAGQFIGGQRSVSYEAEQLHIRG